MRNLSLLCRKKLTVFGFLLLHHDTLNLSSSENDNASSCQAADKTRSLFLTRFIAFVQAVFLVLIFGTVLAPMQVAYAVPGDVDNDGILDEGDLDNDNDGILDTDEGFALVEAEAPTFTTPLITGNSFLGTYSWAAGSGNYQIDWTANNGGAATGSGVSTNGGGYVLWNANLAYNLDASLTVSSNANSEQLAIFGYVDDDPASFNEGFTSLFGSYTISWTGGAAGATATIIDPANQTTEADGAVFANGATFNQVAGPVNGGFRNDALQWGVVAPEGATSINVQASNGARLEGFRFASLVTYETTIDSDADGIPDHLDLDSDNDGISDLQESGADLAVVDIDGDGIHDGAVDANGVPVDAAGGVTPLDSDGDVIPDSVDGFGDSDGDGVPNYLDIDSDNDGLTDTEEVGSSLENPVDTDGDGLPNYIDVDSDNDGLTDAFEAVGNDADGDGVVNGFVDADGNGHDDNTAANPFDVSDSDGDGYFNFLDLDSDNDGLPDVWESAGPEADANGDGYLDDITDLDGDGLADNVVANDVVDTDGDGSTNHLDIDADNDGTGDLAEAGGSDLNGDGLVDAWTDSDGDGIVDSVDVDITGGEDADGDGIDDFADADFVNLIDSDGDGIVDLFDDDFLGTGFLPFSADGEFISSTDLPDVDGDGVIDVLEPNEPEPAPAAALPQGAIHTGLAGSGCAIGTEGSTPDPLLPLLVSLAAGTLLTRRSIHETVLKKSK